MSRKYQTSLSRQLDRLASRGPAAAPRVSGMHSVLFDASEAARLDTETVRSLALNGLSELSALDPRLADFAATLLAPAACGTPPELRAPAEREAVGERVDALLALLWPHALTRAAHKVLEYLVRNYKAYALNADAMLALALPYHATALWARVAAMARLEGRWLWLVPYARAESPAPLERSAIVEACAADPALLAWVEGLAGRALAAGALCRPVVALCAAVALGVAASGRLDTKLVRAVLPFVTGGLRAGDQSPEWRAAALAVAARLGAAVMLTTRMRESVVCAIVESAGADGCDAAAATALAHLCATQAPASLPRAAVEGRAGRLSALVRAASASEGCNVAALARAAVATLCELREWVCAVEVLLAAGQRHAGTLVRDAAVPALLRGAQEGGAGAEKAVARALRALSARFAPEVDAALDSHLREGGDADVALRVAAHAFAGTHHAPLAAGAEGGVLALALRHPAASARAAAVARVAAAGEASEGSREFAVQAAVEALGDEAEEVVLAALAASWALAAAPREVLVERLVALLGSPLARASAAVARECLGALSHAGALFSREALERAWPRLLAVSPSDAEFVRAYSAGTPGGHALFSGKHWADVARALLPTPPPEALALAVTRALARSVAADCAKLSELVAQLAAASPDPRARALSAAALITALRAAKSSEARAALVHAAADVLLGALPAQESACVDVSEDLAELVGALLARAVAGGEASEAEVLALLRGSLALAPEGDEDLAAAVFSRLSRRALSDDVERTLERALAVCAAPEAAVRVLTRVWLSPAARPASCVRAISVATAFVRAVGGVSVEATLMLVAPLFAVLHHEHRLVRNAALGCLLSLSALGAQLPPAVAALLRVVAAARDELVAEPALIEAACQQAASAPGGALSAADADAAARWLVQHALGDGILIEGEARDSIVRIAGACSPAEAVGIMAADGGVNRLGVADAAVVALFVGAMSVAYLPRIVPAMLDRLAGPAGAAEAAEAAAVSAQQLAALSAFEVLLRQELVAPFVSPYVERLLAALVRPPLLHCLPAARVLSLLGTAPSLDPRVLLAPAFAVFGAAAAGAATVVRVLGFVRDVVARMAPAAAAAHRTALAEFFVGAFGTRRRLWREGCALADVDAALVDVVVQLVLKLNENSFKPLFLRLLDHFTTDDDDTTGDDADGDWRRNRAAFFARLVDALAERLRSIFVPYFGFVLDRFIAQLNARDSESAAASAGEAPAAPARGKRARDDAGEAAERVREGEAALAAAVLDALAKCFAHDTESFIRERARYDRTYPAVAGQLANVALGAERHAALAARHVVPCLAALAVAARGDAYWKPLTTALLGLTRHDRAEVRRVALGAVAEVWRKAGEDMVTLLPETVPYLSESMEDPSPDVVNAAHELAAVLQSYLGEESLKDYL
eukprot:m51a1_g10237 putative heat repeat-containing protein (1407) ;mRNA; f:13976-18330